MMLRTYLALCLTVLTCSISTAQEPWAIMTGQSVIEVRAGLRHIYQRLGRKDLVAALDSAAVTNLVSGNLKGLDLNRPLGTIVLPSKAGTGCLLTFIPITGDQAFLEFLRRHLLTVNTDKAGTATVDIPLLGTAHIRFDQQYAWLAFSADDLNRTLPNLTKELPEYHRRTQLAATIYLERIPMNQRHAWLLKGDQGLQWLFKGATESKGQLAESLALPVVNLMLKRLAEDARDVTILANTDRKTDQLWAKILVTPRPDRPWLAEVQRRAETPQRLELPASYWAKLRGKSDEIAARAAKTAFVNGQSDKLILTMQGGNQLELKAELSGSMLAYHAALNEPEAKPERRPTRRERRRTPPR